MARQLDRRRQVPRFQRRHDRREVDLALAEEELLVHVGGRRAGRSSAPDSPPWTLTGLGSTRCFGFDRVFGLLGGGKHHEPRIDRSICAAVFRSGRSGLFSFLYQQAIALLQ